MEIKDIKNWWKGLALILVLLIVILIFKKPISLGLHPIYKIPQSTHVVYYQCYDPSKCSFTGEKITLNNSYWLRQKERFILADNETTIETDKCGERFVVSLLNNTSKIHNNQIVIANKGYEFSIALTSCEFKLLSGSDCLFDAPVYIAQKCEAIINTTALSSVNDSFYIVKDNFNPIISGGEILPLGERSTE